LFIDNCSQTPANALSRISFFGGAVNNETTVTTMKGTRMEIHADSGEFFCPKTKNSVIIMVMPEKNVRRGKRTGNNAPRKRHKVYNDRNLKL